MYGSVGQIRHVAEWTGELRWGQVRCVMVGYGVAVEICYGADGHGKERSVKADEVRHGA